MKTMKITFFQIIIILSFLLILSACDEFISSEYRISSEQTLELLNVKEPKLINSSNKSVATAMIESGGIVITSVAQGYTEVFVSDSPAGLSNSARIQVNVDDTGKIRVKIYPFDESNQIKVIFKQNVTIEGTVGIDISPSVIYLMLDGTHFIADEDMDASSWITNLPSGLSAVISYVQDAEFPHEVKITVSGIPQASCSELITITIPKDNTPTGWDIYVESRSGAQFDISG